VIWTDIGAMIVTLAVAPLTSSPATGETAVIVTTRLEAGTVGGAVKVAGFPLAVWAGEIEPHEEVEQLTDQFTPEFVVSFATSAATGAVVLGSIVLGGA
jgi:hypothetical protein